MKKIISENLKTLLYALFIAVIIRSIFIQPFYIPSSSMEPNLLVGDRLFVTKYSYGYSRHSFPFSPPLFKNRIFNKSPEKGDVIVFKTPADNRTDYIKRLVGLPGDTIQFIDGLLFINDLEVLKDLKSRKDEIFCGNNLIDVNTFKEKISDKEFITVYGKHYSFQNSEKFIVPEKHYFFLGDNRDCSKDSRFLSSVGYVHENNLVGKARVIFFSNDTVKGSLLKFWNLGNSFRIDRTFKKIK